MRTHVPLILLLPVAVASPAHAPKLLLFAAGGSGSDGVPATQAGLDQPFGIDFDKEGKATIVELKGARIHRINSSGMLTRLAGTGAKGNDGDGGPVREATFNGMHSLAVAPDGTVYVADT